MEIKENEINIINDALKGDQKAYTYLMERYKDGLLHTIKKIVGDELDAEDLLIESFAKAFDNLNQYDATYAFSTWLYKIASNTCIDFLRKKRIEAISLDASANYIEDNFLYSDTENPETTLINTQKKQKIRQYINSLDTSLATVIEYRYLKELSYDEIAAALHLPIGTVKVQIHRAKKRLYEIIKDNEDSL
ncbi:MAG: sigma-70 family RNA polymerase sigma factor [Chitinophagales bacterium]|nr:sigma-70 family RNA polymerase sigma factor [Chitinophagales bacterium]